jgi:N-formylglutamate amidohydrolase
LLISLPHAGTKIPSEVEDLCILSPKQIEQDNDKYALEIYGWAAEQCQFIATSVPRAIVDLNRSPDDRGPDGVVKTHTIFREPIYERPLDETVIDLLLENHYWPYHRRLTSMASHVQIGIDCHTMLGEAPPIGEESGRIRPAICISNDDGRTCPSEMLNQLADCLRQSLEVDVALNDPFKGGYITRRHARELPWMQLEVSRAPFLTVDAKRDGLFNALVTFAESFVKT